MQNKITVPMKLTVPMLAAFCSSLTSDLFDNPTVASVQRLWDAMCFASIVENAQENCDRLS